MLPIAYCLFDAYWVYIESWMFDSLQLKPFQLCPY